MIRVAMPGDTAQLVKIGRKIIVEQMTFLRPDDDRTKRIIIESISSAQHLVLVSENSEGVIVGGAVVLTQPFAYAEKLHSQIVAVYTTEKGDTVKLMDHILKWFYKRKASLLLCYAAPISTKLDRLMLAKHFKQDGTMLVLRRY